MVRGLLGMTFWSVFRLWGQSKLIYLKIQEEPYKMALFGKDVDELEVVTADFLPHGKKLYILVADSDCNLHVLQYDPEGKESTST